tara:strand:- start:83 stop:670 length:588 start_codon:yes stop_codon:yes gene_type:complete
MSDEILEDNDKFKSFLSKVSQYKRAIVIVIILLITAISLFLFFNLRNENKNILASEQFNLAKILIQNDNKDEAKRMLVEIVKDSNKFYSPLSLNLIIDQELENDPKKIYELFDEVISIKKIDKENINLIKIKKALFLTQHRDEEQEIIKILNPIINSESIWRGTAIKILGDYFLYKGENLKSEEYYKLLRIKENE